MMLKLVSAQSLICQPFPVKYCSAPQVDNVINKWIVYGNNLKDALKL